MFLDSTMINWFSLNPLPTLVRICNVALKPGKSPFDRFRGCVGTVRIDNNYTKPPGPTPRDVVHARTLTLAPVLRLPLDLTTNQMHRISPPQL